MQPKFIVFLGIITDFSSDIELYTFTFVGPCYTSILNYGYSTDNGQVHLIPEW